MGEFKQIKKICSFYANDAHFVTMILPYINQKIQKKDIIKPILQKSFDDIMKEITDKIILKQETKNEILKINWKKTNDITKEKIENILKKTIIKDEKENNIIVLGEINYIIKVNELIKDYVQKNDIMSKLNIINCYNIDMFTIQRTNICDILKKHDYVLNTSGIKEIQEVAIKYEKEQKAI